MLFFALAFILVGQLHSFEYVFPSARAFSAANRAGSRILAVYASQFDKEMVELDQLSRAELQSLAKEYGIKATGKTTDLIDQLGLSIASVRNDADLLLPSVEQTLKVSPLEKTITLDSSAGILQIIKQISHTSDQVYAISVASSPYKLSVPLSIYLYLSFNTKSPSFDSCCQNW